MQKLNAGAVGQRAVRQCRPFLTAVFLGLTIFSAGAQQTLEWRAEAGSGLWNDPTAWWNGTGMQAPAGNEVLLIKQSGPLATTNNLAGAATNRFRIVFGSESGPINIRGSVENSFNPVVGQNPGIENHSSSEQTIGFPIAARVTPLEINAVNGGIILDGAVNVGSLSNVLVKHGAGVLTLAGTAENVGGAVVQQGTLVLAKSSVPGSVRALTGPATVQGTLKLGGSGGDQIANNVSFTLSNGIFDLGGWSETLDVISGTGLITNSGSGSSVLSIGGANGSGTFSGRIVNGSGSIGLSKFGAGTITLEGSNNYSGVTRVTASAGKLVVTPASTGSGEYIVNGRATLGVRAGTAGTLRMSKLSLSADANVEVTLSNVIGREVEVVNVVGELTAVSPAYINVGGGEFAVGETLLLRYGSLPMYAPSLGTLPPGVTGILVHNETEKTFRLRVTVVSALRWTGGGANLWNTNSDNEVWLQNGNTVSYQQNSSGGRAVVFDDGGTATNVILNTRVSPISVTVSNVARNYLLNGTGGIGGYARLTKTGSGKLTLGVGLSNDYSGVTAVVGGELQILGAKLGSGATEIHTNAVLSGSGIVVGPVLVAGTLRPGVGCGSITTGAQQWRSGGRLELEMSDAAGISGAGWDAVQVNGGVDVQATGADPFVIELVSLSGTGAPGVCAGFDPDRAYSWRIVTANGSGMNFATDKVRVDTTRFQNDLAGGRYVVTNDGAGISLVFVPSGGSDTPAGGRAHSIRFEAGVATISFVGAPGESFDVERSTNLVNWMVVETLTAPQGGAVSFTDPSPPADAAFYRLRRR